MPIARVCGLGSRHQPRQRSCDAGAGAADRRAWQAGSGTLGQRAGVHLAPHAGLGGRLEVRPGPYPAGSTDAERPRRKLPRQAARRMPQHKLVQNPQRCPIYSLGLAPGIQHRTSPQLARLPHPARVPPDARRERGHGPSPFENPKPSTPRNSSYEWMRRKGQVSSIHGPASQETGYHSVLGGSLRTNQNLAFKIICDVFLYDSETNEQIFLLKLDSNRP